LRYNLFYYAHVLSFYARARKDDRYGEALEMLKSKLDERGRLVVERPNRKLVKFLFCRKGKPSEMATKRYQEIVTNMAS